MKSLNSLKSGNPFTTPIRDNIKFMDIKKPKLDLLKYIEKRHRPNCHTVGEIRRMRETLKDIRSEIIYGKKKNKGILAFSEQIKKHLK